MLKRISLPKWYKWSVMLVSFSFIFFLCYIDEGYYDFSWMRSASNWLFFFIYWMVLFGVGIGGGYLLKFALRS